MSDSYTSYEVIEALQNIGISQEIIEYIVPIAGYESRVDGIPFTRDALDKLSPSWGIFQANVDSMAPGIYKAMNELGVDIPGMSDEQKKVLLTNIAQKGQKELMYFTEDQKEFVVEWFKNEADLDDNALVFKYMLEQKMKDKNTNDFKVAVDDMYPMTVSKFNDLDNEDAQVLKTKITDEVTSFFDDTEPPVSTTTTTIPTTTTTLPPSQGREERILEATPEEKREYESQVGPNVEANTSFEEAKLKTDIARGNSPDMVKIKKTDPNYRKGQFLKYFDRVTSFKKPDPSTFTQPKVEEQEITFPYGRPVNIDEVIDLLEP